MSLALTDAGLRIYMNMCFCSQTKMSVKEKTTPHVLQIRSVRTSREGTPVNVNWDSRWRPGNAKVSAKYNSFSI